DDDSVHAVRLTVIPRAGSHDPPVVNPTTTTTIGGGESGPGGGGGTGFGYGDPNVQFVGYHYMGIGGILHLHANVTTSKSQVTLNWKIGASGGYNTDAHGLTYDETLVVNGCDAVFNAPSTIGS